MRERLAQTKILGVALPIYSEQKKQLVLHQGLAGVVQKSSSNFLYFIQNVVYRKKVPYSNRSGR